MHHPTYLLFLFLLGLLGSCQQESTKNTEEAPKAMAEATPSPSPMEATAVGPADAQTDDGMSWEFTKKNGQVIGKNLGTGEEKIIVEDQKEEGGGETSEESYSIASYAGPYISLYQEYYYNAEGAAHPSYGSIFKVLDARTLKPIALTSLFDSKSIYAALMKDKVIMKALQGNTHPTNLEELMGAADGGCEMSFGDNVTDSYAFHHVKGKKVAVRIGLPHGCGAMRGKFSQLGLYLAIPGELMDAFDTANNEGSLMQHLSPEIKTLD